MLSSWKSHEVYQVDAVQLEGLLQHGIGCELTLLNLKLF